jgi:ABC-type uncharacterized transport systems, ATPase components
LENAIEMRAITKTFPGVIANDNVTFSVRKGEIHALLGENGAGKSTLMSILFGAYSPDNGTILINGKEVQIKDPNVATQLGIGMVHQHFKLIAPFTVTENIVLGTEPKKMKVVLDLATAEKKVREISERYGLDVDPRAKIQDITVGQQQRVEILKTLYRECDIIIFDEPTAVLTPQEIDELMDILRLLKSLGKTVILITHKLKEIKAVADRCTVLRRGRTIGTINVADVSEQEMAEMMVGRPVLFQIEKGEAKPGKELLNVENIYVDNALGAEKIHGLSLSVKEGEILGVAGVDGNGQTELLYALSGLLPVKSGKIILDGKDVTALSIRERAELGLGHIPEDRQKHGFVSEFTIAENCALKTYYLPPFAKNGQLQQQEMVMNAEELIKDFDIRAGEGALTPTGSLSGGNQQKVIVAREISLSPKVLLVAQPTRGLDVGAIEYIRKRIIAERDKGKAILLVSFELDEIMNLCDRIATMSKGTIVDINDADKITAQEIGLMMAGSKKETVDEA